MRATLVLRYFEDLTEEATARELGCSIGAVKSQTHHALKRLRAALPDLELVRGDVMTTTEIREALTEVQPPWRSPRSTSSPSGPGSAPSAERHVASRAVMAGAAAAVLAAGAVSVAHLVDGGHGRDVPVASGAPESGGRVVSETVWFVRNGRLTALDPSGDVHDLGLRSEGVIGWTSEQVYALDEESHVVVLGRETDHEGLGKDTAYPREDSPVPGAVQSAALSAEGRYLAWLGLDDTVTVYDLFADRVDFRVDVPRSSYVAAVSGDASWSRRTSTWSCTPRPGRSRCPTQEAGDDWGAQLTMGRVLVAGPSGESNLYDLSWARPTHRGPAGRQPRAGDVAVAAATIETRPDDSAVVNLWDGRATRPVRGLDGIPEQIRFADETTLLVQTRGGSSALWSCSVTELTCAALPVPDGGLWLLR